MKKLIAMLLTLTMMFALCACGNEAETAKIEGSVSSAAADIPDEKQETKPDDFTIEDFAICKVQYGRVIFKLKVRNNTDKDVNHLSLNYQIVDQSGDALVNNHFGTSNLLLAGQGSWIGDYPVELDECKEGVMIRFVSYNENSLGDATKFNYMPEFDFAQQLAEFVEQDESDNSVVVNVAEEDSTGEDPIAVEEVAIKKSSATISIKMRNNSEEVKEVIQLGVQMLDSAGDVLSATEICAFNLDAGQAGSTEFDEIECDLADVSAIKVVNYSYGTGTKSLRMFPSSGKHNMNNPIIIPIEDVTIK